MDLKVTDEKGPDLGALLSLQETMAAGEWRTASDAAQVIANFLRCHPCVAEVRYPGLTSDPAYREASSTLRGGFGPLVWLRVAGSDGPDSGAGWYILRASGADPYDQVMELEGFLGRRS